MRSTILLVLLSGLCSAQPALLRPSDAAPGSWLSLSGFRLSTTERAWRSSDFNGGALPLALDGISVKINGKSAPIAYVSEGRIEVLVPSDAGVGDVPLVLTTPAGPVPPATVSLRPLAPRWIGTVVRPNGTTVNAQNPAEIGETVSVFGTGFGPTTPTIDPLTIFSGAAPLAKPEDLAIFMGGREVEITFAGLVGNGLYQFNFAVPPLPENGSNELTADMGEFRASRSATIPIIAPGPPVITGMTASDFIWGQQAAVGLMGSGLQAFNTITISDPSQLTFSSVPIFGGFFQLTVGENATPGTRTITVTSPRGTSNAFPFTIRRGEPRITAVTPSTVWPGRAYPLTVEGVDMAGARSLEVTPATGVRALFGLLQLDSAVPTGTLQLRLKSPWDISPPAPLQVVPAPAAAPTIRTLSPISISTYNANIQGAFSERADYTGEFEFTDADGDSKPGSRMEMIAEINGTIATASGKIELTSKPNTARFTVTKFARTAQRGSFPVWITLMDDAGNRSNALRGTIDAWWN